MRVVRIGFVVKAIFLGLLFIPSLMPSLAKGETFRHSSLCAAYLSQMIETISNPPTQMNVPAILREMRGFSLRELGRSPRRPSARPIRFADSHSDGNEIDRVAERIRYLGITQSDHQKTYAIKVYGRDEITSFLSSVQENARSWGRAGPKAYIYVNLAIIAYLALSNEPSRWMSNPDLMVPMMTLAGFLFALGEFDATILRWIPNLNFSHHRWFQSFTSGKKRSSEPAWAYASLEGKLSDELVSAITNRQYRFFSRALWRHFVTENAGMLFRTLDSIVRENVHRIYSDPENQTPRYDKALPQSWVTVDLLYRADDKGVPSLVLFIRIARSRPVAPAQLFSESESTASGALVPIPVR